MREPDQRLATHLRNARLWPAGTLRETREIEGRRRPIEHDVWVRWDARPAPVAVLLHGNGTVYEGLVEACAYLGQRHAQAVDLDTPSIECPNQDTILTLMVRVRLEPDEAIVESMEVHPVPREQWRSWSVQWATYPWFSPPAQEPNDG